MHIFHSMKWDDLLLIYDVLLYTLHRNSTMVVKMMVITKYGRLFKIHKVKNLLLRVTSKRQKNEVRLFKQPDRNVFCSISVCCVISFREPIGSLPLPGKLQRQIFEFGSWLRSWPIWNIWSGGVLGVTFYRRTDDVYRFVFGARLWHVWCKAMEWGLSGESVLVDSYRTSHEQVMVSSTGISSISTEYLRLWTIDSNRSFS